MLPGVPGVRRVFAGAIDLPLEGLRLEELGAGCLYAPQQSLLALSTILLKGSLELFLSLPFLSALLDCSGVLAIVEENGLEEVLVCGCRLLD